MATTRDWQRLEGGMVLVSALGFAFTIGLPFPLWVVPIAFLIPDISILAYSAGRRVGALAYNAVHTYGFGTFVALIGMMAGSVDIMWIGLLFFARTGFDRMIGNGLRRAKGFRHTHLGPIGGWIDDMNGPKADQEDLYTVSMGHITTPKQLETKTS
jgi:hypothetical protein